MKNLMSSLFGKGHGHRIECEEDQHVKECLRDLESIALVANEQQKVIKKTFHGVTLLVDANGLQYFKAGRKIENPETIDTFILRKFRSHYNHLVVEVTPYA